MNFIMLTLQPFHLLCKALPIQGNQLRRSKKTIKILSDDIFEDYCNQSFGQQQKKYLKIKLVSQQLMCHSCSGIFFLKVNIQLEGFGYTGSFHCYTPMSQTIEACESDLRRLQCERVECNSILFIPFCLWSDRNICKCVYNLLKIQRIIMLTYTMLFDASETNQVQLIRWHPCMCITGSY